jgi:hypothetical protein
MCRLEQILIALTVATFSPSAAAYDVFSLQSLDIGYTKMFPGGVDPQITQNPSLPRRTLGERLEARFDTSVLTFGYWDNRIHSATDAHLQSDGSAVSGQFRHIGLQMRLGINVTDRVQVGYWHHSQHVLDAEYAPGPFPREDGLELRVRLFSNPNKPAAVF